MLDSFSVFRVRLGYLSSFLSTSCITSLHFIPDSDEGKWYFSVINFRLYFRRLPIPVFHSPRGVGGEPLPYLAYTDMCYVPLNRVWFSRSWVLNRVYNFTIKLLEQGVVLDWKPFKECEDLRSAVYICNTNNFFLNTYFHDFSVESYLIVYVKQNKSRSERSASYPKQGTGSGFEGLCGTALRRLPVSAPPPPPAFDPPRRRWKGVSAGSFFRTVPGTRLHDFFQVLLKSSKRISFDTV